jgi:hypothetical protein
MFLGIGILLIVLWLGGFLIFHTAGFLIYMLLMLAVMSFVFHFLRGTCINSPVQPHVAQERCFRDCPTRV